MVPHRIVVLLCLVLLVRSFDLDQLAADLQLVAGLGGQYFNFNNSCTVPSNLTSVPQVSIDTVQDLLQISSFRKQYPANQLVYFQLTAADSDNGPAYYLETVGVNIFTNMSCSYIRGLGMEVTSILADYPFNANAGFANIGPALNAQSATDVIIVDVTIDRTNSSFTTPATSCQNQGSITNSTFCMTYDTNNYHSSNNIQDVSRFHFARFRTWGGVAYTGSGNSTISSCFLSSVGNTISYTSDSLSSALANEFIPAGLITFNNTITAPFGSGISTYYVQGLWFHHNYIFNCGWSPVTCGWSPNTTIEYNFCDNYSFYPGSPGGSAGVYLYGGWAVWGYVVRHNWFFSPSQKCFYFDGVTSNVLFEYNVCYVSSNELNGGRYNTLKNNLFLALRTGNAGTHLGDLNCPAMDAPDLTPYQTLSCYNTIAHSINSGYTRYSPWSNLYPNGTEMYPPTPQITAAINHLPTINYTIWCAPTTAGPNNTPCATNVTTYTSNGTTYPFPCEILPSNNYLGTQDFVAFVVVFNASKTGNWNPGFGCGPCNPYTGHTGGCPLPAAPGWTPWIYDASQIIFELSWFNSTFYSWAEYNQADSTSLFGAFLNLTDPTFVLTPETYVLTPDSQLAQDTPELLLLDVPNMGLQIYCPQLVAPVNGNVTCTNDGPLIRTTQCTFSCLQGYSVFGSSLLTCQYIGQWDNTAPICTRNDCPLLTAPTNGDITFTLGRQQTSIATFTCLYGYSLSNPSNSICQSDNNWSNPVPACNIVQSYCPAFTSPANAQVSCTASQEIGSICSTTCVIGSKINGTSTFQCSASTQTTGVWNEPLATCPIILNYCPVVTISYGTASCSNGLIINSTCSFECNLGFYLSSTSISTCSAQSTSAGIWTPTIPTCSYINNYCPTLSNKVNGNAPSYSSYQRVGSTAGFSCHTNYIPIGPSVLYCDPFNATIGVWSGSVPACGLASAYCPYLSIPNGIASCSNGQLVNSSCSFTCNQGYTINSTSTVMTCQSTISNAVWIGGSLPSCSVTDYCPALPIISNGSWICTSGQQLSSSCMFSCAPNYTPSAATSPIICLTHNSTNGIWNGTLVLSCNPPSGSNTTTTTTSTTGPTGAATPTPSSNTTNDSNNNVALGVGLGVGLGLLFILAIIVIFFLIRRYRQQPYKPASEMQTYSVQ